MSAVSRPSARGVANGADGELNEWRSRTRVFLQPIAAPSILGLYGFACATFVVTAYLVGWYGKPTSPLLIFPVRHCRRRDRAGRGGPVGVQGARRAGHRDPRHLGGGSGGTLRHADVSGHPMAVSHASSTSGACAEEPSAISSSTRPGTAAWISSDGLPNDEAAYRAAVSGLIRSVNGSPASIDANSMTHAPSSGDSWLPAPSRTV
jgi:hypothetical protein